MDESDLKKEYDEELMAAYKKSKGHPEEYLLNIIQSNYENKLQALRKDKEKEAAYKEELISTLNQIELNTASIKEIIDLIKINNDCQDDIVTIITELLSISKQKEKELAEKKYIKVMDSIGKLSANIETITKLYGFGTTIYSILKSRGIL